LWYGRALPLEVNIPYSRMTRWHVTSQQTRSQLENKEPAIERFVELLRDALRKVPIRKKTRISKGAKLRRLEGKKQYGLLKSERSERVPVED
jgi:ribosome-associated protein